MISANLYHHPCSHTSQFPSIFGLTNRPQNRRQFLPWFQLLYYPPPTGMTRTCIEMGRRGPSWNDWRMRCEEDPSAPFTGPFWLKSNNTSTKRHTTLKPTTASELTSYTNNYRQTLSQRPNPSQWRVSRRMQAQQTKHAFIKWILESSSCADPDVKASLTNTKGEVSNTGPDRADNGSRHSTTRPGMETVDVPPANASPQATGARQDP